MKDGVTTKDNWEMEIIMKTTMICQVILDKKN